MEKSGRKFLIILDFPALSALVVPVSLIAVVFYYSDIIFPFAMADPDSRARPAQCPRLRNVDFTRRELIPEMVHGRCFCEPGSREFVEFERADVEPFDARKDDESRASRCELYRTTAYVKFSGETRSFPLIVKLPPDSADCPAPSGSFQNEEMFYSKMTLEYGTDGVPKCYLSDLGRYGRPVIVLEDLAASGYVRADRKLNRDHLKLCVKALATFHGRGLKLRADKFAVFREYYAKLSEASFDDDSVKRHRRNAARYYVSVIVEAIYIIDKNRDSVFFFKYAL